MTKIGVLLSGCGFKDGSEIHEATLALYFLDRAGAQVVCMAPDAAQHDVVDHATGRATRESRNMLVEAARIARGKIVDLASVSTAELDGLVMPGGFGAAKNLCDFALQGGRAQAHPQVQRVLREMHAARKPIGAICIAPAVVAASFRGTATHAKLTIGEHAGTADALRALGAEHANCGVREFVVDEANRIVSTPAYMYDARISEVAAGIERLVAEVMRLSSLGSSAHPSPSRATS